MNADYEALFPVRLAQLREKKGVSAREMSLDLGQNHGYITAIENGKAFPSIPGLISICRYLEITPSEFFDMDNRNPGLNNRLQESISYLNEEQQNLLVNLVDQINYGKSKK